MTLNYVNSVYTFLASCFGHMISSLHLVLSNNDLQHVMGSSSALLLQC